MYYGRLTQEIQFRLRGEWDTIRHFPAGTLVTVGSLRTDPQVHIRVARQISVANAPEWILMALDDYHIRLLTPLELLAEAAE